MTPIRYARFDELAGLVDAKIISRLPHPSLPLFIYNYTARAQETPRTQWTEAMCDCRGLILDDAGSVIGRPFRKFWNYEQVIEQIPDEPFTVMEKLDGSLGIICSYAGERVVATRGSFESDQARWLASWLDRKHPDFCPSGETWLTEIIFPENRIVVDYGKRAEAVLLSVMAPDGVELPALFDGCARFAKARRFDGMTDFSVIDTDPQFAGEEGFVVRWQSGFRAKCKLAEYKRLHRLITQCSTRTIWELMRSGAGIQELIDRVPGEFAEWVNGIAGGLAYKHCDITATCLAAFLEQGVSHLPRKDYALWAKAQPYSNVLFALLDSKPTADMIWKMIEPKWSTPFRRDIDA